MLNADERFFWQRAAEDLGTHRTAEAVKRHWHMIKSAPPSINYAPIPMWTRLQRTSVPCKWRPLAYGHPFYLVSSTFYAFAGITLGLLERGKPHAIPGEFLIWIVQTLLTHKSDVVTLGEDNFWHGLDRIHAYTFTAIRSTATMYAYWCWNAYSDVQAGVFACGLVMGLVCIRLSWMAVNRRDAAAFLRWHALWHLALPATAVCVGLLH